MVDLSNHLEHSECEYYIYLTLGINERKGFLYVGQHKCNVKGEFDDNYFGSGTVIKSIKKKYGMEYVRDNFKCIPIWWCETKEQANQMEQFFIAEYQTKEIGANLTEGGEGISNPSEETRRKMSIARKGKSSWNKGKHHSEEAKRKIGKSNSVALKGKHPSEETRRKRSIALKGRVVSEETKQKISIARKGKFAGENNPMFGKHLSEETKRKMSIAMKGAYCKGKVQAIKDGVVIAELCGKKEIDDFIGKKGSYNNISKCINGRTKSAYGYQWKRVSK